MFYFFEFFVNQILLIILIKSRMQRLSFLLFFVTGICFAIVSFGRYAVNREYIYRTLSDQCPAADRTLDNYVAVEEVLVSQY